MMTDQPESVDPGERLQKVLARVGFGARRVCEELIAEGRATINGAIAILGDRVRDGDIVRVDGKEIGTRPDLVYYLLNKPAGVITAASDARGRRVVIDLVPADPRVFPVGRLDYETEGLLLLTNDGALTHLVTHPSSGVEKEYLAEVGGVGPSGIGPGALRTLREGVELDDGLTAPARVSQPEPGVLRITIHEGRNRQVRRMCEAVGHPVLRLVRLRIGPIADRTLVPGAHRELALEEVRALYSAAGRSD